MVIDSEYIIMYFLITSSSVVMWVKEANWMNRHIKKSSLL